MAKDELAHFEELAVLTYNWMKESGAIHNYDKHTRHTITVDDWAKYFGRHLNEEGELTIRSYQEWQHVKLEMIRLGLAIAISPAGHYIGKEGEQATNIIYNISHALARIRTATQQMEMVKESGKYEAVRKEMRGKVNPDRIMGLIEASKGVSTFPDYQFAASGDLLLLVAETEEKDKDKL